MVRFFVARPHRLKDQAGGVGTFIMNLQVALHARGHEMAVCDINGPDPQPISRWRWCTKEGDILLFNRPDEVMRYLRFRQPRICVIHGDVLNAMRYKRGLIGVLYGIMEPLFLSRYDRIYIVDPISLETYRNRYPRLKDRMRMLPLGSDTRRFNLRDRDEVRDRIGLEKDVKVILSVSRLAPEKRVDLLIRSADLAFRSDPSIRVVIVGDGTLRADLESLAAEVEVPVTFTGIVSPDEVGMYYSAADVFMMLSRYEGGPLTIQECLLSGTYVLATDVGRVREYLFDERLGRVVEPDIEVIAEAISDHREAIPLELNRKVKERFGFDASADDLLEDLAAIGILPR